VVEQRFRKPQVIGSTPIVGSIFPNKFLINSHAPGTLYTMILDKLEGLQALESAGIHVARCAYVDSPESAIAFATRRSARDERFVPIGLRAASKRQSDPDESSLVGEAGIRDAYARLVAKVPANRILAQIEVGEGSDVAVRGRAGESGKKVLELRGRTHSAQEPMPLDEERARALAENFRDFGHKPQRAMEVMLAHFLMELATFFERPEIEELTLDPVRLHEGSYSVLDAEIVASRPLHLKPRIDPRARDRKGHFTPSGRQ
jgi:hypothetical protein